jgi:hypothetical protein
MNNMSTQDVDLPSGENSERLEILTVADVKMVGELKVKLANIRMVLTKKFGEETKENKVWIDLIVNGNPTKSWIPNQTSLTRLGEIFSTKKGSELEGKDVTLTTEKHEKYKKEMIVPQLAE